MTTTIAENLERVRASVAGAAVAAGRSPEEITLIAVSKEKPAAAVAEALAAGQRVFGENRVQEALGKIESVAGKAEGETEWEAEGKAEWHLIGHLQTNKARMVPGRFRAVHSLDSGRLARALDRHAESAGVVLDVFLQLNLAREASKTGVEDAAELGRLMECVLGCTALRARGLMTLPDPALDETATRRHFAQVRELQTKLGADFDLGPAFDQLSMGMSHDFLWAIAEGATMVRVGTAIFGARK